MTFFNTLSKLNISSHTVPQLYKVKGFNLKAQSIRSKSDSKSATKNSILQHDSEKKSNGWLVALLSLLATGTTYAVYNLDEVPISGRKRILNVSRDTELHFASKAYEDLNTMYSDNILPHDNENVRRVERVGRKIISSSGLPNLSSIEWQFFVVNSNDARAVALPNGKVIVFKGILNIIDNDDQLAAVMSHEIAHILARHGAEHWSYVRFLGGCEGIAKQFGFRSLANKIVNYSMSIPFSRYCESEADHIGLLLMSKSCFDPRKTLDFWRTMQNEEQKKGSTSLKYSSTHPTHEQRIVQLENWMPEAIMELNRSQCNQYKNMLSVWSHNNSTSKGNLKTPQANIMNNDVQLLFNIIDM